MMVLIRIDCAGRITHDSNAKMSYSDMIGDGGKIQAMSDIVLYFFPTDPLIRPAKAAIEAALVEAETLFGQGPHGHCKIEAGGGNLPEFISCMGNFQTVRCVSCAQELLSWWQQAMDEWWNGARINLRVTTPCCGVTTDLNSLDYDGPQGFACFHISVWNPGRVDVPACCIQLSAVLGTPLRTIWSHI